MVGGAGCTGGGGVKRGDDPRPGDVLTAIVCETAII